MKAIALISGGLDSTLAAKLIIEQGIEVYALNTLSPFCTCGGGRNREESCRHEAVNVAEKLGIKLKVVNIAQELMEIIKNPGHGFGSNMNPCIDCRILTFKKAKEYMSGIGASFIITGEVLAQRPMSQNRYTIGLIEREAGLEGLVLRPLSGGFFPPTVAEKEGWVDSGKFPSISGRSRKEQMRLAENLGIKDYACPAGGCLLTDAEFSKRVKDLLKYNELTVENVHLLKAGRYLRLRGNLKVVIGRDERENARLERLRAGGDYFFTPSGDLAGPSALARGELTGEDVRYICAMAAAYCDIASGQEAQIEVLYPSGKKEFFNVLPLDRREFRRLLI